MTDRSKPSKLLDETSDIKGSNVVEEFGAAILDVVHRSDQDAIVFFASDGDVEYANQRALEMFDTKRLVGENYFDLRDSDWAHLGKKPQFGDEHIELIKRAFRGESTRGEFTLKGPDGTHEMEVLYGPVRDREDNILGIIAGYRDVTDWRQFNELLRSQNKEIERQRAFLASVLDVLDDGVIAFDDDFRVVMCNPACNTLLGIDAAVKPETLDELLEMSDLLRPEAMRIQLERIGNDETEISGVHLAADGAELRCLEVSAAVTEPPLQQLICTVRDITDWQQVQQFQLLATIGRLTGERLSVEAMATRLVDEIFEQLNVDIAVLALFDRDRLKPVVWRGLMLEPEFGVDPLVHHGVQEALERGEPMETDGGEWEGPGHEMTGAHYVVPLTASGERIGTLHLGSLQSVRLFSAPGRSFADPADTFDRVDRTFLSALGGYVAVALESTRLYESSVEATARLQALVERIPDGVVLFNARGEILHFNEAATDIAGFEWKNLNSDSRPYRIRSLDGRPLPRGEWPFFHAVRTNESVLHQELVFDFGDERRHIEVNVLPVQGSDAQIPTFVGTLKDVTERSEQDRRKDEFLSVASHELRSPMTPLTGFIQMTRRQIERGEMPDLDIVARAEYQVERLSRLIDSLLDMTRLETGRMLLNRERVDLTELVFRTLDAWRSHPKDFELVIDVPRQHGIIASVDPGRIDQVITNIVDNAVKHVEPGGTVRVGLRASANEATIVIEDDGEGIPKQALDHIFDRFYQADEQPLTGVGLGLYITREIVLQHGGDITVDSDPGVRTVVEISLPLEPH